MSDTNRARPSLVVFDTDRFDGPRDAMLIAAGPSSPHTDRTGIAAACRATFARGAWEASA
jgi:hypothetical protein